MIQQHLLDMIEPCHYALRFFDDFMHQLSSNYFASIIFLFRDFLGAIIVILVALIYLHTLFIPNITSYLELLTLIFVFALSRNLIKNNFIGLKDLGFKINPIINFYS